MRIEIICTGDEVLTGKTVNTNYSHIARRLFEVGLDVVHGTTVGDDREALLGAFRRATERADAVIVNGGLGPTVDDLSQEVAAEAAGVDLVLDEDWLARIEGFYRARGREMPPNNRKQAMLPRGAERVDNPVGTACGFAVDVAGTRFFFTPGVPRELHRMLDDELLPRLLALSGTRITVRLKRFHSFGLGESRVDQMLSGDDALAGATDVRLGFQAHYPQLETKLLASGADEAEVEARLAPATEAVRERLGAYLVAEDAGTLEGNVLAALGDADGSLAVVECGTHGAVAGRLAAADPEGAVFRRGGLGASAAALGSALGVEGVEAEEPAAAAARLAGAVRVRARPCRRPRAPRGWRRRRPASLARRA